MGNTQLNLEKKDLVLLDIKIVHYQTFFRVIALLLLAFGVSYFLKLEATLGIPNLLLVTTIGYVIHSATVKRFRPLLLFILSVVCCFIVLNWQNVLFLYAIGTVIFLIADSSLSNKIKALVLLSLALALSVLRIYFDLSFIQTRLWVILASIFMFRTILFIQEKHSIAGNQPKVKRFNYFFLFPNIFAPLFPIVDYKDYNKEVSQTDENRLSIQGVNLLALGIIQLIVYRILYTLLLPAATEVNNVSSLLIYIVINYLLVFRLMGLLNISVGVLRLFGFNLPEIFNNIFIATCVSDFFRRLNIYWKEFLLNTFYYPIYFKYRKRGMMKALSISAIITFILNWFFHAYQWFWILGTSPIRWTDTIFWSLFSIVAITEMLYQAKYSNKKNKNNFDLFVWPLKVMITFAFIAVIWSLWTSPGLSFWAQMIQNSYASSAINYNSIIVNILTTYFLLLIYKKFINDAFEDIFVSKQNLWYSGNCLILILVLLLSVVNISKNTSEETTKKIAQFISPEKNIDDQEKEAEGYYDGILEFNIGSANWDAAVEDQPNDNTELEGVHGLKIQLNDLRLMHYLPNQEVNRGRGRFATNSIGIRDKEYTALPEDDVVRIALFGGSPEAGLGIGNDDIFEAIVEDSLNNIAMSNSLKFEILNFTVNKHTASNYRVTLDLDALQTKPRYAMFTLRTRDFMYAYKKLYKPYVQNSIIIEDRFKQFLKSNIEFYTPMSLEMQTKYGEMIWLWNYKDIKRICIENNIIPVFLYIPELDQRSNKNSNLTQMKAYANELEIDFIDLSGVYDGYDIETLNINYNATGNHPNELGHKAIANRLFDEMVDYFKLIQ